ncbi:uncharacterized protein LOC104582684 isoform X2 [Brachypodium distachyon]|uniref:FAR1 domain-containing protein n=1 Tax=Brachypodium distachyon TaxID=15368 RepID=A0A0Q3K6T2_BRADI|nr:uncharacterized protein LOC104582684 isoform X2 [Brachypodium distachyon]KQK06569.1 hypothetical protein BRADI_2g27040v3 [Brachypodium distachyon]|eukprot:XP_010231467.1 uncharacterized protein LOC104582684 isoform X2 [Brachypodium distachyon]
MSLWKIPAMELLNRYVQWRNRFLALVLMLSAIGCPMAEKKHGESRMASWKPDMLMAEMKQRCLGGRRDPGSFCRASIGNAPEERKPNPNKQSALELSIRGYAERRSGVVVAPAVGTTFDSLQEAYDFYNLYSWEIGFGVRYAKSRLNVHRKKCMQEIVCSCSGKPLKENMRSARTGCTALIRLLRSADNGWYVCEHREERNHPLSNTCGEKLHWQSHRHIDPYTKELVRHLRENNVSLGKVYSIIGSFFGSLENVPFTKRSLKTLCGKISREQSDNDAGKIGHPVLSFSPSCHTAAAAASPPAPLPISEASSAAAAAMAFEKIKVANPIVEMDSQIPLPLLRQIDLSRGHGAVRLSI